MVYLYAEDKVRLIRQLQRDSSDIEEIFRRYHADEKDFTKLRIDEIKEHIPVHIVLNNTDNQYDDNEFIMRDLLHKTLMKLLKRSKVSKNYTIIFKYKRVGMTP